MCPPLVEVLELRLEEREADQEQLAELAGQELEFGAQDRACLADMHSERQAARAREDQLQRETNLLQSKILVLEARLEEASVDVEELETYASKLERMVHSNGPLKEKGTSSSPNVCAPLLRTVSK